MLGLIKGTVRRLDAALYKYNVVTGLYVLDTWERAPSGACGHGNRLHCLTRNAYGCRGSQIP
eukprot:scaffold1658_cov393-Prasinococcus_capsulatus_cf.AAC.23